MRTNKPSSRFPGSRDESDFMQSMYRVVDDADAQNPVGEYIEHRNALLNKEGKRNRLDGAIKFARDVRLRFLKMNLQEREVFLQVLTSDENDEFRTLFALQAELKSAGIDDERVEKASAIAPRLNRQHLTGKGRLIDAVRIAHEDGARRQFKHGTMAARRALPGKNALALGSDTDE